MHSTPPRQTRWNLAALPACAALLVWLPARAGAQDVSPPPAVRQSLDDAWWTGSLLAPSAATLPHGHFLIEPYLYDVVAAHSNGFGSRTFMVYGLADRVSVGLIPTVSYTTVSNGPSSSAAGLGDLTAQAQYRLTQFHAGNWMPTVSMVVQETFPTGKYDQLGDRPSDGFGSGAWTTTLALYSQTYLWMPNGRILRMRLNVSQAFSSTVNVADVSVYATGAGFRGHASPGSSSSVDAAAEYSLTRSWVLALDVTYGYNGNTRVSGADILAPASGQNPTDIRLDSGTSTPFGFAPAIEYSWTPRVGVILGARVIPRGHNTAATITPAVAINIVR